MYIDRLAVWSYVLAVVQRLIPPAGATWPAIGTRHYHDPRSRFLGLARAGGDRRRVAVKRWGLWRGDTALAHLLVTSVLFLLCTAAVGLVRFSPVVARVDSNTNRSPPMPVRDYTFLGRPRASARTAGGWSMPRSSSATAASTSASAAPSTASSRTSSAPTSPITTATNSTSRPARRGLRHRRRHAAARTIAACAPSTSSTPASPWSRSRRTAI